MMFLKHSYFGCVYSFYNQALKLAHTNGINLYQNKAIVIWWICKTDILQWYEYIYILKYIEWKHILKNVMHN